MIFRTFETSCIVLLRKPVPGIIKVYTKDFRHLQRDAYITVNFGFVD